jgi:CheY-like chemotaxis protein
MESSIASTPTSEPALAPSLRRPKVLVVDDDLEQRQALAEMLEEQGFVVASFADGDEALAALATHRPDLLILDGVMPRVDGWQVLGRLSADPALCTLPVIFMSATCHCISRRPQISFLPKPLQLRVLLRAIEGLGVRAPAAGRGLSARDG